MVLLAVGVAVAVPLVLLPVGVAVVALVLLPMGVAEMVAAVALVLPLVLPLGVVLAALLPVGVVVVALWGSWSAIGSACVQIEVPEQWLHSVVRGYTLPSGPLVDQSPRVRLYIPV